MVSAYNEHLLEKIHQERERLLHFVPEVIQDSKYTGYGEYGGIFFYYGNMNSEASQSITRSSSEDGNSDDSSDEVDMASIQNCDSACLDFFLEVEGPLDLAPLKYIEIYEKPGPEQRYNIIMANEIKPTFKLSLSTYCSISLANKLPCIFNWTVSAKDFDVLNTSNFKSDNYCSVPVGKSETTTSD